MNIQLFIEIVGAIIGLVYLWLEYRASFWLWIVGIVMSVFYIYIYYYEKFYADMGTYVYYLGANIYGLILWKRQGEQRAESGGIEDTDSMTTRSLPFRLIWPLAGIFVLAFLVLFLILSKRTDSPVPYGDAFTTALSIVAMWMMAKKYYQHWLLWVVVNITSTGLYFWKGLYPTAILFVFYTIGSVMGYFKWKSLEENMKECSN